jgi:hypothetical protein
MNPFLYTWRRWNLFLLFKLICQCWTGRYPHNASTFGREESDCVFLMAFGNRGREDPGKTNLGLAAYFNVFLENFPFIGQEEVGKSYLRRFARPKKFFQIERVDGRSIDSYEALTQMVGIMRDNGWSRPLLLAYPYHVPRCRAILRKLGVEPIILEPKDMKWRLTTDPKSCQWQTRSRLRWSLYEPLVICLFWLKGRLA